MTKTIKHLNLRLFFSYLALSFLLIISCSKKERSSNPCDGLLNETPPTKILLKLIKKSTGENLILSEQIKEEEILIVNKESNEVVSNWQVRQTDSSNSPLNGTLGLSVFHETEGKYAYKIKLGNEGSVTLSYRIDKKESGNPCKPYSFPMYDLKIDDHPFTLQEHQGMSISNFLVLEL